MTLSAVADHKKIAVEKIEIQIDCIADKGFDPSTLFTIDIDFGGSLTQREQTILLNSARNCEIGKILTGRVKLNIGLIAGT
ncbi:hypothetical protein [Desulfotignum phosphitoxidans]|uniref:hypothetical protein n=1 Tax=Desulfotignum phosphitoxidans TaxID=190898 RepID=UPI0005870835|nr:hypothetical protein [Desulfotignum phosphitoxidans]